MIMDYLGFYDPSRRNFYKQKISQEFLTDNIWNIRIILHVNIRNIEKRNKVLATRIIKLQNRTLLSRI